MGSQISSQLSQLKDVLNLSNNYRLTLDVRARKFTQSQVREITQNFRIKIGEGGYGQVYLGHIDNGDKVAVKTLIPSMLSSTGVEGFQAEASILGEIHHRNLVKLIGYCADKRHLALVYEYMEGGSLHDHLSDEGKRSQLSWRKRLQIACEVAEGLKYLHKDCYPPIIHRDIKSANILLTKDLEAKIGEFGFSKMFENDSVNAPAIVETNAPPSHMLVTTAAGTFGYRDPEHFWYERTRKLSDDVYRFGVVLMVLITGLSPFVTIVERTIHITDWVSERVSSSEIDEIIDKRIKEEYDENYVSDFVKIAQKCTMMDHEERPDIIEVVEEIKKLCTAYDESHPPLKKFTRQAIAKITKNGEKIGEGGYGKVYRWTLDNGVQVAVKTLLRHNLSESGVKGFQAEASIYFSCKILLIKDLFIQASAIYLRNDHKNLVKLIGYCDDDIKHVALVYEYMEGGSLHDHLSDEDKRSQLSWRKRLQIACEVAEGLKYLHKDCYPPIIHRDIKPANILLTKDLEAKIGGFRLSKIFKIDAATHATVSQKAGTPGYNESEPSMQARKRADVYSFGVVLMNLVTGLPPNIDYVWEDDIEGNCAIVDWIRHTPEVDEEVRTIFDENIENDYDADSVRKVVNLAKDCTKSDQRPNISDVADVLKACLPKRSKKNHASSSKEVNLERSDAPMLPKGAEGFQAEELVEKLTNLFEVPMPKKFTHQDIAMIAINGVIIGKGGYGKVYRWTLPNGDKVAVKTLKEDKFSKSGVEGFQAEVSTLTKVHHKKLVKLMGYCDDDIKHLALVYEYMEGGSLHDHLSDEGKRSQLSWRKRLQIACEVAEGLKYLHKDCDPSIIHRDIKPGNILLTKKLEARIGDFGLSKMFEGDGSHMTLKGAAGTLGYWDPEYVYTNRLRDSSDVYSFGVVLMQLITGLHNAFIDLDRNIHITDWVRERVSSSEIKKIIDETINQEYDEKSVLALAKIAVECARTKSKERPDITEVVEQIKKLCTAYDRGKNLLEVSMPKKFTRQDIARITENVDAVIGEGGYGNVYRWTLDNGLQVAVKTLLRHKLSESGVKGFQAEVSTLTKVHHKKLVKLMGYCDDDIKHLALVYEYMEGGSLHDHLSDEDKRAELSWRKRLQIACEVAEGLKYLHKDCYPPIIHRDIKPHNILLTENLEARIGDFGLSKMFEGDGSHMTLKGAAGTLGYWDPEYVYTNRLRDSSDVYSFGVVLMQLITGLHNAFIDLDRNIHITDWVRERVSSSEIKKIIDETINQEYDEKSVLAFAKIAVECARTKSKERPDIIKVVKDLEELCTAYDESHPPTNDNPQEQPLLHK